MRKVWLLCLLAPLAACEDSPSALGVAGSESVKLEVFCSVPGLERPVRETLLVIDASAVKDASPETFREANADLFGAVTGLADAQRALSSGAVAPRERITISVANTQTGGLKDIFTGCLPALSTDELTARAQKGEDGALDAFFGSDMASKLSEAQQEFLMKAVLTVAQVKPSAAKGGGDDFNSSAFARLFRIIGPGPGEKSRVRRLIVFSDPGAALSNVPQNYAEARTMAFAQGELAEGNLGMAELYLVPASRMVNEVERAYLDAWLLSAGADLRHVGVFSPSAFAKPPVKLFTYAGDLPLVPGILNPMELWLAPAADGTLSSGWINYTGKKGVRRTPVAGSFVCVSDVCELRGNPDNALGQRWRTEPGTEPQPLVDGPFGGMRLISGKDNGSTLKGRIYDPIIFVNESGDIEFTAKRTE